MRMLLVGAHFMHVFEIDESHNVWFAWPLGGICACIFFATRTCCQVANVMLFEVGGVHSVRFSAALAARVAIALPML